ncbi:heterokaryon incompatibility protein-domain-containing protein [Fusarium solani]|uniref:Heterokaryon incompatibility protein-domain-containing protein n=1 Tax=Fusarium solani TaxID=169388 RepID=A0A9P9RAG8_FUSSL|nr:heterokaryon incompatibility protein-domain-containing protein [Fusarium solani]KAH7270940.1 heterokaryon incompatibility protein-domain-containing protein [Fusarium solani]
MELSPRKDTVDDEFCAWYSRPDLEHAFFLHNANVLPTDLCTECKESASHELIKIYNNNLDGYTFRKTYAEICRDAAVCALCRAIDDSTHLSRLFPPVATPSAVPPPDSTIHLNSHFYDSFVGEEGEGYYVFARLPNDNLPTDSDAQPYRGHESDNSSGEGGSARSSSRSAHESIELGYLDLVVSESIDTDTNSSRRVSADSQLERLQGATVDLCIASPRNPSSSFPAGNTGRENTAPSMRSTLFSWLQTCDDDHEGCVAMREARDSIGTEATRPSRMIHLRVVGGQLRLRICQPYESSQPYTALSYCWGGSDLLKTTLGSYSDFQDDIPAGGLCETIWQAARITYAIGVSYIWVDSLCIIQDDVEDWAREAPKMKDVYANAYLTISASALGRNGCYPYKLRESRHAKITDDEDEMRLIPQPSDAANWNMLNEPLQSRGWTLQERLLSHRILYCSKFDYYWLCRETQECAAHRFASDFFDCDGIDSDERVSVDFLYDLPLLLPPSAQPTQALILWYKMLLDYSARLLTEPTDKLPAIEGITQRFKTWIKSDCLHGLWQSDLAYGLMWRRPRFDFAVESSSTEYPYDSSYDNRLVPGRGPSWSWASMDGYLEQLGIYLKLKMWRMSQDDHQALEASVTVADEDEHSMYPGSTSITNPCLLKIRGQLLALKYDCGSEEWREGMPYWQLQDPQPGDKVKVDFTADDPSFDPSEYTSGPEPKIYLLPLLGLMAIVITPTDRPNVYRRIGLSNDMDLTLIHLMDSRDFSSNDSFESTSTSDFTQESSSGSDGTEDEDVAALEDSDEELESDSRHEPNSSRAHSGRSKEKASANSASDRSSVSQDESSRGSERPLPWEEQYSPSAKFSTIFVC